MFTVFSRVHMGCVKHEIFTRIYLVNTDCIVKFAKVESNESESLLGMYYKHLCVKSRNGGKGT